MRRKQDDEGSKRHQGRRQAFANEANPVQPSVVRLGGAVSEALLLAGSELAALTCWSQVAYAAWWARCVQPLIHAGWLDMPERRARALENGISLAASAAQGEKFRVEQHKAAGHDLSAILAALPEAHGSAFALEAAYAASDAVYAALHAALDQGDRTLTRAGNAVAHAVTAVAAVGPESVKVPGQVRLHACDGSVIIWPRPTRPSRTKSAPKDRPGRPQRPGKEAMAHPKSKSAELPVSELAADVSSNLQRVHVQVSELQWQVARQMEKTLNKYAGRSFGSLAANKEFAGRVNALLQAHALRLVCPGCHAHALLHVQTAGTTREGAFQFQHSFEGRKTRHKGSAAVPAFLIVPVSASDRSAEQPADATQ